MYGGTRGRDRMRHSVDEANSGFSTHQSKRRRRRGGGKEGEWWGREEEDRRPALGQHLPFTPFLSRTGLPDDDNKLTSIACCNRQQATTVALAEKGESAGIWSGSLGPRLATLSLYIFIPVFSPSVPHLKGGGGKKIGETSSLDAGRPTSPPPPSTLEWPSLEEEIKQRLGRKSFSSKFLRLKLALETKNAKHRLERTNTIKIIYYFSTSVRVRSTYMALHLQKR